MTNRPADGLSVLLIEDREDVAQSTAELLTLCGHAPRVAACGEAALSEVARDVPDVVLVDLGLPDMDGWDVARQIRARAGRQPVMIAVTGRGTEGDRIASADAGLDLHLVKPADPRALTGLLARIRESLSDRSASGSNWVRAAR
ncbi:response regulator [Gemmata sp. JC717]|uniref:response regulator n=1 Tax=Gemmata algarum TaxID=2975278 RepID=UPI0021BA6F02|nr:response regulator [Gemmata algarum]MDY3553679.1 response regulator [Gemmata algarum]